MGRAPDAPTAWPACYNRLDTLYSWLDSYAAAHPNLVEVIDYGNSWCKQQGGCITTGGQTIGGHDLWVARITNELAAGPKTGRFFTDGGIHAREIPTPGVGQDFHRDPGRRLRHRPQRDLAAGPAGDLRGVGQQPGRPRLVELGTEPPYTGNPWYWRKNGNNGVAGSNCLRLAAHSGSSHYGIDLNRNHIFKWNIAGGSSTAVCDQDYRGRRPAPSRRSWPTKTSCARSSPTSAGRATTTRRPLTATGLLINLHNYVSGGVILVPWGWTTALGA